MVPWIPISMALKSQWSWGLKKFQYSKIPLLTDESLFIFYEDWGIHKLDSILTLSFYLRYLWWGSNVGIQKKWESRKTLIINNLKLLKVDFPWLYKENGNLFYENLVAKYAFQNPRKSGLGFRRMGNLLELSTYINVGPMLEIQAV